jgi:hypothetical protein
MLLTVWLLKQVLVSRTVRVSERQFRRDVAEVDGLFRDDETREGGTH